MSKETAMLLKGKNAVITGCLRGIGRNCMELFAANGANIWACCQARSEEFEADVRRLAQDHSVAITPLYFDFLRQEEIKAAMKTIVMSKQPVDVLVNIAGMTHNGLFHMTPLEKMKEVFEVDFFSQMLITQYLTKVMARQKSGSVIYVSSISALDGNRGQLSYSASKAALVGATRTLAAELADYNIRVNAIAPGVIQTEMTAGLPQEFYDRQMQKSAIKRLGLPSEVSGVLVFLASNLSSYVTGQIIRVDGGIG